MSSSVQRKRLVASDKYIFRVNLLYYPFLTTKRFYCFRVTPTREVYTITPRAKRIKGRVKHGRRHCTHRQWRRRQLARWRRNVRPWTVESRLYIIALHFPTWRHYGTATIQRLWALCENTTLSRMKIAQSCCTVVWVCVRALVCVCVRNGNQWSAATSVCVCACVRVVCECTCVGVY